MLDTEPTGGGTNASATADTTSTDPSTATGTTPRRRRATRPAQAAEPATSESTPVDAPAAETPAADKPAPRRRRAATRPAAAPAPDSAPEAADADQPVAEAPESETPAAPAKRTRSSRRPAKAVAAEAEAPTETADVTPVTAVAVEVAEVIEIPEPAAPRSRRRRSTAVQFAPPVDESAEAPVDAAVEKAALPPIGSLFQAPDPANATPARRRRSSRPAPVEEAPLLDANGDPIPDELAEELLADATDAVVLEAEASVSTEEVDEEEAPEEDGSTGSASGRRRRRGRRGRGRGRPDDADQTEPNGEAEAEVAESAEEAPAGDDETESDGRGGTRRRRRRRSRGSGEGTEPTLDDPPNTVVRVRTPRGQSSGDDEVRGLTGSTRLEAKRQRRREGREQGKRRPPVLTEAEFLARREAVDRVMVVRQTGDRTQIAVLEDNVLVEHYVTKASATSYAGNVYLGKVQNVLPSDGGGIRRHRQGSQRCALRR